jgi:threonine/homoserine/homoserine lactone efflux protein
MAGIINIRFLDAGAARIPSVSGGVAVLNAYLPLVLFAAVSTMSPGGATTLATASGAHFGFGRSLPLIAGIALGLATMAAAAAAGLGGVLLAVPGLQVAIKAVGSVYLLWLAWGLSRGGPPHAADARRPIGVLGGAWLLWHNPKGRAMTVGAAASFAPLAEGPLRLAALLSATFAVCAAVSLTLWCLAGQMLARWLRRDWHWRVVNVGLALLLVASIVPMWVG